jgi:DNA polymerase III epsilon subunit-like protein
MTRLLVIDTETGGTDPERHSLLSLAGVVWENGAIRGEIEFLVAEPDFSVTARALEINRIDLVAHSRLAVAPRIASGLLEAFVAGHFNDQIEAGEGVVLAGHNVNFDLGFLKRLYRVAGVTFPTFFSHRVVDTASVLRLLAIAGRLPSTAVASSEAFAHLGIAVSAEERHTALGDARATALLLTRLVELISVTADSRG